MGSSATLLFTDTGLPSNSGFWGELVARFSDNLLPSPPVGREVSRLLRRLIDSPEHAEWLLSMPEGTRARLTVLLGLDSETVKRVLDPGLREAAVLLASRIAMHGVSDDLRKRMPVMPAASSPFLLLPEHVKGLLKGELPLAAMQATITACRVCLRDVSASLDQTGISIDLVFRLELINALLTRLSHLVTILYGLEEARELAIVQLERELIRGTVADRTLSALWQSSTRLLARRVVERAGQLGRGLRHSDSQRAAAHARRRRRRWSDHRGDGVPQVLHRRTRTRRRSSTRCCVGLNYAWGFVLMQLLHFALATKQPAMTAATLAAAIEAQRDEDKPEPRFTGRPGGARQPHAVHRAVGERVRGDPLRARRRPVVRIDVRAPRAERRVRGEDRPHPSSALQRDHLLSGDDGRVAVGGEPDRRRGGELLRAARAPRRHRHQPAAAPGDRRQPGEPAVTLPHPAGQRLRRQRGLRAVAGLHADAVRAGGVAARGAPRHLRHRPARLRRAGAGTGGLRPPRLLVGAAVDPDGGVDQLRRELHLRDRGGAARAQPGREGPAVARAGGAAAVPQEPQGVLPRAEGPREKVEAQPQSLAA